MDYHAASHSAIEQNTLLIDIATRNVVRLAPDDSIGEAARIMAEKRISSIVVTDQGGHPSGIVTERNMLHAMQSGCPPETALRCVMSSPVITVPESMTCLDAYQVCLRDGIRHLVIVDQDKLLLGVVSETDFRLHINLSTVSGHNQVVSIMSRSVFSMPPEATLRDALNLMQAHRDTCIVVVDAEYPIGIVTERDIVRLYSDNPARTDFPIREVMTSPVLTVSQEYSINEAAERMSAIKVRHLVVVDRLGRLAGLLSEHDLTHAMTLGLIDDKLIAEGAFLHTLVNTIPDMVWLKDVNGIYLACNPRFERFFGAKEKDIVGKTDYDFVDRELADFFREHDRKAMEKDGKSVNEEWVAYADDGHRELLETLKTPMRDSQGKLIGILGIARDITEHRRLEEKLEESVKKFHCIFESACDCIELISMNGLIMDMNHVGYEWLGYKKTEMQGHRLAEFGTPEYAARVPERMALIKNQGHAKFESARLRKDGSIVPIEVSSRIVELDGQPMFLSISRDITERKQAEQALLASKSLLREQKEFLASILDSSLDAFMLMDSKGVITNWSSQAEKMFGWKREEAIGRLMHETITPARYREAHVRGVKQFLSNGEGPVLNTRIEVSALHRDGHEFPVELSISRIKTADGYEISAFVRDISQRKRMEQQLDDYRQRLEEQVAEESTKFRALVEQSLVGNYIIQDGMFRYVNSGFAEIFGYDSPKDIINRIPVVQVVAPEDRDRVAENIRKRLSGEIDRIRFSFIGRKRDETAIVVDVHGRAIEYQGKPVIIGTLMDITETRRSQQELERLVDEKSSELRRSEEKLRTLIEAIPDPIQFKDGEGRWLESNCSARQVFGLENFDCHGKTDEELSQIAEPRFREPLLQCRMTDEQAWNADGVSRLEEIVPHDDGSNLFFDVIKKPLFHEDGKRAGLVIIGRDVTALRRSQEALAEREGLFRAIFNQASSGIELIDPDSLRFVEANPAACGMLGYTHEEYLQLRLVDTQADQDEKALVTAVQQIEVSGGMFFENRHRCKNGNILDVEVSARILDLPDKRLLVGVWRNITERKRAEQALRESEEKLRSLYELSPLGIALTGMNGHYVEFNESFRRICGYTGEELKTLDYWDLTPKKYETDEARQLESLASTGRYGPYEKEYVRKDGSLVPLRLNGVLVTGRDGQKYIWSIVEDITEHKRVEQALRENEAKYRQLFETAGDGIFLQDASGFIDCNEKGASLYGLSREEIINRSPTDLAPERQPDGRLSSEVAGKMIAAALGGEPQQFEWRALRANGDPLDVDINLNRIELGGTVCLQAVVRDISERKRAELQLRESELQYRTLADSGQALIWTAGTDKLCDYFNKVWLEFTGRSLQQEIGNGWVEGVHPDDSQRCLDIYVSSFDQREKFGMDYRLRRHDGEYRWIRDEGSPRHNSEGEFIGYIGFCLDITERKHAEDSLRIIAGVFDTSQEAILITDANNIIVDVNPAFTQITSYSREEVLGHNPKLLSSGRHDSAFYGAMWRSLKQERAWRGEIWNRRKSGEIYVELLSISVICDDDGKVQRHVGVFSDISYLKEHEAELSRVAHYDSLTGIPNRVLLADRMNQAIAKTAREQNRVAVCYLDLDGFKSINDTIGHDAGDQVLVEVARRIGDTIRGGDTVARLGGDEFVVLLELEKGEECVATLERLLAVIAQPITIKNQPQMLSASIGVSIYPLDDEDSDTLLRHADQAMYIAKQSGKNRFFIYDPELDLRARDRNEFLKNIRHGLERDQFELYFQPKIDLLTKRLVGAEALIRWRHPERGLLSPIEFLRPIENTELDIEIGNWVIATALAQINRWHGAGLDIEVSINISAYHLESSGFVEKLRQQLARYSDLPPGKLQIEILETAALNDLAIVRGIIEECRKIGVGFALDDFGTGYSSLSYLSKLPVDVLKIDQSFVRDMLEDNGDNAIIQGIIALARAFDRQVVAEGIETEEHYRALLNMGCQIGQGYVIARPMPVNELTNWQAE